MFQGSQSDVISFAFALTLCLDSLNANVTSSCTAQLIRTFEFLGEFLVFYLRPRSLQCLHASHSWQSHNLESFGGSLIIYGTNIHLNLFKSWLEYFRTDIRVCCKWLLPVGFKSSRMCWTELWDVPVSVRIFKTINTTNIKSNTTVCCSGLWWPQSAVLSK